MENKPLLSICIPTYNRAEYLEKSLESIIHQSAFDTEEVEVVVSDNCSTDDTEKIVLAYAEKYTNIRYFKNKTNVIDDNFRLAFQRANGILRKLSNDTVIYMDGAFEYLINNIRSAAAERPVIFCSNADIVSDRSKAGSIDEFLDTVSYQVTWIASMCLWEEDCNDLSVFQDNIETRLAQVPFTLEKIKEHKSALILNNKIMEVQNPVPRNISYGLFKVFQINFFSILNSYVSKGDISKETIEKIKTDMLFNFYTHWLVQIETNPQNYILSDEKLYELLLEEYKDNPALTAFKRKIFIMRAKSKLKKAAKKIICRK